MLGNDVVDLREAETEASSRHPRFDARVFAEPERRALEGGVPALRWIFWAAKESAYKAARRLDPRTVFSPRHFAVELVSESSGWVEALGRRFRFWLERRGDCLHAVALEAGACSQSLRWGTGGLHQAADPSAAGLAARNLARAALAPRLGLAVGELRVDRRGRIPHFVGPGGAALPGALSLSHHGRFVAWAHHPGAGEKP